MALAPTNAVGLAGGLQGASISVALAAVDPTTRGSMVDYLNGDRSDETYDNIKQGLGAALGVFGVHGFLAGAAGYRAGVVRPWAEFEARRGEERQRRIPTAALEEIETATKNNWKRLQEYEDYMEGRAAEESAALGRMAERAAQRDLERAQADPEAYEAELAAREETQRIALEKSR